MHRRHSYAPASRTAPDLIRLNPRGAADAYP